MKGTQIMKPMTRNLLIVAFIGVSLAASGALGHAGVTGKEYVTGMLAGLGKVEQSAAPELSPVHTWAVPYFPAQYKLDAPSGPSEPFSTF
jgi:hypothetical protein